MMMIAMIAASNAVASVVRRIRFKAVCVAAVGFKINLEAAATSLRAVPVDAGPESATAGSMGYIGVGTRSPGAS